MTEYKRFEKRRKLKQFFIGMFFIIILIGGWFYPLLGYFIPLCMALGMGIGCFRGRKWCDWFCPRGSFFDGIIAPISPKRKIPAFFKVVPFRLGMLFLLMAMMTIQIIKRWPDPYKIGMFFVIMLSGTTTLGGILALILHQRVWCCFCPIGSMANWVGRKKYTLKINSKLCTECRLCHNVCPMQIAPYKFKKDSVEIIRDGDCLKCRSCVEVCPKNALSF